MCQLIRKFNTNNTTQTWLTRRNCHPYLHAFFASQLVFIYLFIYLFMSWIEFRLKIKTNLIYYLKMRTK
ncbi:MAG: hypothetical protein N7Q72_06605, partial [Spiroplasma sp. Tabriz.8]|nr:hypothetical protein [Spiroplasma sp. Tabriz.8]